MYNIVQTTMASFFRVSNHIFNATHMKFIECYKMTDDMHTINVTLVEDGKEHKKSFSMLASKAKETMKRIEMALVERKVVQKV